MGDRDFKIFISQLENLEKSQRYPSQNNIGYWKNVVDDYYEMAGVENYCFALCNAIDVDTTSDFADSTIGAKLCKLCASNSNRHYEIKRRWLPHVLKSKFDAGLVDDFLILCEAEGKRNGNGDVLLEYKQVSRHMIYTNFSVIHQGILQIVFTGTAKILSWDFCVQSAKIQQSPSADQLTTAGTSDIKTVIDNYGLPKSFRRIIHMGDTSNIMTDIIDYSIQHGIGPIASMELQYVNYHWDRAPVELQEDDDE